MVLNVDVDLIIALGSLLDLSNIETDIIALIKRYINRVTILILLKNRNLLIFCFRFSHHKKDLNKLCNYLVDLKNKSADTIFIFYTLKGNIFKLMIC